MSNIPENWLVPWHEQPHKNYIDACAWVRDWYEQENVKVLAEMAICKERIKKCQISFDVNNIDLKDPMSRLRVGRATEEDWASYCSLGMNIEKDLAEIQEARHILEECRRHLMFLKYQIEQAKEDYEEAIEWEQQAQEYADAKEDKCNNKNDML